MKRLSWMLFFLLTSAQAGYVTYGVGNHSCLVVVKNWDLGKRDQYKHFVEGYLTQTNRFVEEKQVVVIAPRIIALYVSRVCRVKNKTFEETLDMVLATLSYRYDSG